MKKLILGIILIVILFSGCSSQIDQQETDNGLGTGTETDNNGSGTYTSSVSEEGSGIEYKRDVLFGIVKDMIVYKNELYFLTVDGYIAPGNAEIYKYIDETTPPELQLSTWNKDAKTKYDCHSTTYLNNFAIYNQQLFVGGPCGFLKLNEETGEWIEPNFKFKYNFASKYLEEYGTTFNQIKLMNGDLYAIVVYKGIFKDPYPEGTDLEFQEDYVTSLFKLNGTVWEEVSNPYIHTDYRMPKGITDIEYYNQTYYAAYGGISKFLKNDEITKKVSKILEQDEINNGAWFNIEDKDSIYNIEDIYDIEENELYFTSIIEIEPYKNELFACGAPGKKGNVYRLVSEEQYEDRIFVGHWNPELPQLVGHWNFELPQHEKCTFMKEDSGKLYVGVHYPLEYVDGVPQFPSDMQPLHVYDGESWQAIDLSQAPGLPSYLRIVGVTNVQTFNGKLYIAVDVKGGYDPNYRVGDKPEPCCPLFYTLDSNGNLEEIIWYEELRYITVLGQK